jgi:hypothetical protein
MKKLSIENFLKLSPEEQAKSIERETKELLKRLPTLKKQLKMYGETSDELYNLGSDEIELIGSTYARAVRGGSITTPSGKQAYANFIKNLRRYTRTDISQLAKETAEQRMQSFIDHIVKNSHNEDEKLKAQQLYDMMSDSDKLGFTRSKLFLDVEDWGSDQFQLFIQKYDYSVSFVKFQEYMKQKGYDVDEVYKKKN